jgi:hypothetical protein
MVIVRVYSDGMVLPNANTIESGRGILEDANPDPDSCSSPFEQASAAGRANSAAPVRDFGLSPFSVAGLCVSEGSIQKF